MHDTPLKQYGMILGAFIAFMAVMIMMWPKPAHSQGLQRLCFNTSGSNCVPVDASNPYPVTSTITASTPLTVTGTVSAAQGTVPWVSGSSGQTTSTPTVQASGYSAGDCIGGFNAVTVTDTNGQSGYITSFLVTNLTALTPTLTVYLFDSNPSASVCTDNGTFSLSSADITKLIAPPTAITLAVPTSSTTPSTASIDFIPPRPFVAGGSSASGVKTIYYGMVTTAITPASTSGFSTRTGFSLN